MPDPDSTPPPQAATRERGYPIAHGPATPSLPAILAGEIARRGPLPFPEFMATALYHPGLGYYARGSRQVGRSGDFFTSVSVGPLFGRLLARRFLREWQETGRPARWRVIECGAHDGTLAADILEEIARLEPAALEGLEYAIAEPLPLLRDAQHATLAAHGGSVRIVPDVAELTADPLPGIAFGNELLDALPFHLVEWRGGSWHECRVTTGSGNGEFAWDSTQVVSPCDANPSADEGETATSPSSAVPPATSPQSLHLSSLSRALAPLGTDFPEGYRTEIRTNYRDLLAPLLRALQSGLLLWPDYGFARPEYYHPARKTGTLRTFSKHRAAENPLHHPGEIDITAHVDFTAVASVALGLGCTPLAFRNQGSWLTTNARDWLMEQETATRPDPALLRQFQTLTHPAHLGGSFHILELSWNQPGKTSPPADLHRLALP